MPDLSTIGPILFFAFPILMILLLIYNRHREKKRTQALQILAEELGIAFTPGFDDTLLSRLERFGLFNLGYFRTCKNVMSLNRNNANLMIFEYSYKTRSQSSNRTSSRTRTHFYTVVTMHSEALTQPDFSLRPENFFDSLGAFLGFQDIDFNEHQGFSDTFVLKSNDEQATREFFDRKLLDFFAQRNDWNVESIAGMFLTAQHGRLSPEKYPEFIEDAFSIYAALTERIERG